MTLRDLPDLRGRLLDKAAADLGLPERDVTDPTGHVCVMERDPAYRRRIGQALRRLAERLESE